MSTSTKHLILKGYIFKDLKTSLSLWLAPLVFLRNLFKNIYNGLLKIIWAELIESKTIDDTIHNVIIYCLFFATCLLLFYLKPYKEYLLIFFVILWNLDYNLAKQQFLSLQKESTVKLEKDQNDQFIWTFATQSKDPAIMYFEGGRVRQISLAERLIQGGAFQASVGRVWQVQIVLYDYQYLSLLIQEEKELTKDIHETAYLLAELFEVPIILNGSQGNGKYAESPLLPFEVITSPSIQCQQNAESWHIYSKWRLKNTGILFKQIFQDTGFFIFILLMTVLMPEIGAFIHALLNHQPLNITIDGVNFWSNRETFQLIILILPIIYQGWHLSREKHIYLDRSALKFSIDNKKINQVATNSIETVLSLERGKPSLLVLGKNKYFFIGPFQKKEEALAFLAFLEAGLKALHPNI